MSLERRAEILLPGNGTSDLAERIAATGLFQEVFATDAAQGISESMTVKTRCLERKRFGSSTLRFLRDSILSSSFENSFFDVIVDKGLLDALVCSIEGNLGQVVGADAPSLAHVAEKEYLRLLRPGGLLVVVSGRPLKSVMAPFAVGTSWMLVEEICFEAGVFSRHESTKLTAWFGGERTSAVARFLSDLDSKFRICRLLVLRRL
jgi:SAM-dependent methyltransferase